MRAVVPLIKVEEVYKVSILQKSLISFLYLSGIGIEIGLMP